MRPNNARIPHDARVLIFQHRQKGLKVSEVTALINQAGFNYSCDSVQRFLRRFKKRQNLFDLKRKGRPNDWSEDVHRKILKLVDDKMYEDNEITGSVMAETIKKETNVMDINERKVKILRQKLGWAYFDANSKFSVGGDENKTMRMEFCQRIIENEQLMQSGFKYCCFVDDCTIQLDLERFNYQCFTKNFHRLIRIPSKVRDTIRVHIWAGISYNGATELCIFDGKIPLTDALFVRIIRELFKPFELRKYNGKCTLIHSSNPAHDSLYIEEQFIEMGGVESIVLPMQSADLNPMTWIWDELQEYLQNDTKLTTLEHLMASIQRFWAAKATKALCCENINRLLTVIPKVVELKGESAYQ